MTALYTTTSYWNIANYGPQDYLLWHRVIYGNVLRLHKRQELLIGQYVIEGSKTGSVFVREWRQEETLLSRKSYIEHNIVDSMSI